MTRTNKDYLKSNVADEFSDMMRIIALYVELKRVSEYILDLQLYRKDGEFSEARIWLTNDISDNRVGIHLCLYSVNLDGIYDEPITEEEAIEIFLEYQKYFAMNQDKFVVKHYDSLLDEERETTVNFKFEISPRGF